MNRLEALLRHAAADLERLGMGWALVGGLAVSVRSEARFTRDIDLAVSIADDDAAEQVIRSLVAVGYCVLAAVEQETVGRLATVRLGPPQAANDDPVLDLLFASSGIEPEIVASAEQLAIVPDIAGPVARVGHLIAVKLLACDDQRRPQDVMDLRALRAVADPAELDVARYATRLITDRGFSRGRDLDGALDLLLAR